jgi:hypothetical protein
MFALDSNPEVHRYLGENPVKNIEQSQEVIKTDDESDMKKMVLADGQLLKREVACL